MTLTKEKFRQTCLEKLRALPSTNRLYLDSLVNAKLFELLKSCRNKSILFYYPLSSEVDLRKIMNIVRKRNNVYLPFMEHQSFKMVRFRLPLQKKKFGIYEAGNSLRNFKTVDIVIVPTVGIDGNMQRVGFGKGMYDRFFASLQKKPYTIFVQAKRCFTTQKICDSYDVSCDELVTPQTKKRDNNRKNYVKRNTNRRLYSHD